MNSTLGKIIVKKIFSSIALISTFCTLILACTSSKKIKQEVNILDFHHTSLKQDIKDSTVSFSNINATDGHFEVSVKETETIPTESVLLDSITKAFKIKAPSVLEELMLAENISGIRSPVADRIVANYLNSENKDPGGHCLTVSKRRFEEAYKQVHGHVMYADLPERMRSKFYSPKEVYSYIYVSASGTHRGWRSLPEEYRGKGSAGAIAYAGMGNLIDSTGIWSGTLRPGALMQVWRFKADYEKVVRGVDIKSLDPYGHSFIFISYVLNEKNEITGLKIADQGFQSYRPLIPRDYEVWWAVNLNI